MAQAPKRAIRPPGGRVVATDLDTDALAHLDGPNLDVLRHDIVVDDLPRETFDLVHTRFVLSQLPERNDVVEHLISTARPAAGRW